ncbi:MAG: MCE family protein [Deltaproteobacteria bacterium]|nr:MCE family protein [Deltaproteobacteria bacterium]
MSHKTNFFKIGLFVISGIIVALVIVVILGAGTLFRKQLLSETYFDESIQGLDVGSAVKYRGMLIGRVKLVAPVATLYAANSRFVLVRFDVFSDFFKGQTSSQMDKAIQSHIEQGLRIRVAPQGLTGTAYLEVDYLDAARFPPLKLEWTPAYPYIPSAPSTMTQYAEAISRIMRSLEKMNFTSLMSNLETIMGTLNRTLERAKLDQLASDTQNVMADLRRITQILNKILEPAQDKPLADDLAATLAAARRVMEKTEKQIGQTMSAIEDSSKNLSKVTKKLDTSSSDLPEIMTQLRLTLKRLDTMLVGPQRDLETTMDNVRQISEHLKDLTDNTRQNPSQIILGDPPRHIKSGDK